LPVPALIVDADDTIRDVNPAAETFLNASKKSLEGHPGLGQALGRRAPGRCVCPHPHRAFRSSSTTSTSAPAAAARLLRRADRAARGQARPRPLAAGSRASLPAVSTVAMNSKSAAKSAIGMAEMLAHEIKNPLAGITGAAQLISMNASGEERELTDLIVEETRRILKLLGQVEEFGNIRPPERRAVNIHDVLDRARKSAAIGFAAHMDIEDDYDPSLPPTYGDPDQLQQVFLNLLKNAAEAGKSGGTIRIRTFYELSLKVRRRDGTGGAVPLQVEIMDDGPGIPPELAADIFEPFVSGRENGTGLGLALISKIISDHDGWIAVDSVPGRTVFRISLPVAPREVSP
jgi:two-component system nitrogen regulation sensor histidine kinase GlnL